jgi:hypothetical protein
MKTLELIPIVFALIAVTWAIKHLLIKNHPERAGS